MRDLKKNVHFTREADKKKNRIRNLSNFSSWFSPQIFIQNLVLSAYLASDLEPPPPRFLFCDALLKFNKIKCLIIKGKSFNLLTIRWKNASYYFVYIVRYSICDKSIVTKEYNMDDPIFELLPLFSVPAAPLSKCL